MSGFTCVFIVGGAVIIYNSVLSGLGAGSSVFGVFVSDNGGLVGSMSMSESIVTNFAFPSTAGGIFLGTGNSIIGGSLIENCSTGIVINQRQVGLFVTTYTSLVGNSEYGIKIPTGIGISHNDVTVSNTVTMNTNAAGDLTLDGTNPITIAELRAAPQKTMVDVNRLNRLAAD